MALHTATEGRLSEELLGYRNGKPVYLCKHESTKAKEQQDYGFEFYDLFQQKRSSLLEVLTTTSQSTALHEPLQARLVTYFGFQMQTKNGETHVCVDRDQIRTAVFAQVDTWKAELQHMNLMLLICSQFLGNILSQETLTSGHKKKPEYVRGFDRSHLLLLQNLLGHLVINSGGFFGWQHQEGDALQCKSEGLRAGDYEDFDLDDDLLDEEDIKFLAPHPDDDEDDDLFYADRRAEHLKYLQDLFVEMNLIIVWNPPGVGSLLEYAEDFFPYYPEAISDRLRMQLADELHDLDKLH